MKYLIIDRRIREIEKNKFKQLGYEIVEINSNKNLYPEISSHTDIFVCKIGDTVIVEPSQYDKLKHISNIEKGNEKIQAQYPYDIKYNVCTIGKKAIHNFKNTDSKIKQELIKQNYELINTTQGYTNCSIAVIDEKSAIVTDKGLYKILKTHNIDVLYIKEELDIKLLNSRKYSNKKGFIGGSISRIQDNIIIFGDLNKIDTNNQIRQFILSKNLKIIDFEGLDIIDYGGIVEINDIKSKVYNSKR